MFVPNPRFGMLGSITAEAECDAAGGRFFPRLFSWMPPSDESQAIS